MNEQSKPCSVSEDGPLTEEKDLSLGEELVKSLRKLTEAGGIHWEHGDPYAKPPKSYLAFLPEVESSFILGEGFLRVFCGTEASKDHTLRGPEVTELYRRVAEISLEAKITAAFRRGMVGGIISSLEAPAEMLSPNPAPSPKLFLVSLGTDRKNVELIVQAEDGKKAVQLARAWSCCEAIEEEEVVRTGLPLALDTSSEGVKYVSHTANRIFSLAYEGRGETMLFLVAARNEAEAEKLAEKAMEDKPMLCGTLKVRDIQEFSISESAVLLAHYCIKD
jgi:hypothetical protein